MTRYDEVVKENEELREMLGRILDNLEDWDKGIEKNGFAWELIRTMISDISKFMDKRWLTR